MVGAGWQSLENEGALTMEHTTTEQSLRERLLAYILDVDHVTFAELANRFGEAFHGGDFQLSKGENIMLWAHLTQEAADAVSELLESGAIEAHPTGMLTYLSDGRGLSLPLVKTCPKYKAPHWLPVALRPPGKGHRANPPKRTPGSSRPVSASETYRGPSDR
jgi:hypothetical protein